MPNLTGYTKWMTKEEFEELLSGLKPHERQYRLIMFIGFFMGLRRREIVSLKWSDIIGDFELLRFMDCKIKNKVHERVIPNIVKKEWEIYKFSWGRIDQSEYIFVPNGRSKNSHLKPNSVTWKFKKLRDKMGLRDHYFYRKDGHPLNRLTFHTLRHAFITHCIEKSDVFMAQKIINHSKVETTAKYGFVLNKLEKEKEIVNMT